MSTTTPSEFAYHHPETLEEAIGLLSSIDEARPLDVSIAGGTRHLLNPGSVGQPRDGDPRAGFAVVDTSRRVATLYRIDYPIQQAQVRIREEGLPDVLAQRLALGR